MTSFLHLIDAVAVDCMCWLLFVCVRPHLPSVGWFSLPYMSIKEGVHSLARPLRVHGVVQNDTDRPGPGRLRFSFSFFSLCPLGRCHGMVYILSIQLRV